MVWKERDNVVAGSSESIPVGQALECSQEESLPRGNVATPTSRPEVEYLEDDKGINLSREALRRCNVLSVPRGCLVNSSLSLTRRR